MEQQQEEQEQTDQESGNIKTSGNGLACRQTSTRWTPTTDQIRILKDLYYNGGVRSPTADQIQKISSRLRQYGKIEGKNVFYWFQNHKARERQKKRFNSSTTTSTHTTSDHHHHHPPPHPHRNDHDHKHDHHLLLNHHHHGIPMQRASSGFHHNGDSMNGVTHGKLDQVPLFHSRFPSFSNGHHYHASSGSDSTINVSNGYMSSHGYGSVDCSISTTGGNNMSCDWFNMEHHHQYYSSLPCNFFNRPKSSLICPESDDHEEEEEEDEDNNGDAYLQHRRTLPLFPMNGEDYINGGGFCKPGESDDDRRGHVSRGPCASLELSLSSFTGVPPDY